MKHPVDVHVGQKIKRRRRMMAVTQQQLGIRVGITFQQVQKYETGANRVSASRLYEIAKALDVPVVFFFEGAKNSQNETTTVGDAECTEAAKSAAPSAELFSNKEAVELMRSYHRLSEVPRQRLLELTRALSNMFEESGDKLPKADWSEPQHLEADAFRGSDRIRRRRPA